MFKGEIEATLNSKLLDLRPHCRRYCFISFGLTPGFLRLQFASILYYL